MKRLYQVYKTLHLDALVWASSESDAKASADYSLSRMIAERDATLDLNEVSAVITEVYDDDYLVIASNLSYKEAREVDESYERGRDDEAA